MPEEAVQFDLFSWAMPEEYALRDEFALQIVYQVREQWSISSEQYAERTLKPQINHFISVSDMSVT